ncbi:MAG: 7-cyano-7-deazaguanine synthase QueC [Bacteroidales bacterium]|nr:7-cyano-7-deazaguanine synthase QueC [Bacteroidales bacterium]
MKSRKALVLLSGGQDSTTCLYWAKNRFGSIEAIGFNYGQRHVRELEIASTTAQEAGVSYYIATVNTLSDVSENALTKNSIDVEESVTAGMPPNTLVEGRNLLFLTYAAIYAKSKGINDLVIGVSQTDYSNYPDCREQFIRSAENSLSLAMDYKFTVHAPLMWRTKAETWLLADELGVLNIIRHNTLTCYNGIIGDGCGNCPACKLRKKGWDEYVFSSKFKVQSSKFKV